MVHRNCWLAVALLSWVNAAAAAPDEWTRLDQQTAAQYQARDYVAAAVSAQQALVLAERDSDAGPGAVRLATSLNALALIEQAQGRLGEAQTLLERALTVAEKALPADHPNLIALRANLASVRDAQHGQALADEARQAQDFNEQALAHHERGEYEQAASLYEQALPLVEKHFGTDSVEVARVLASLAGTYAARKQYPQAEALYQRALELFDAYQGEVIAQAGVLNELATVEYLQRRYAKAEPLFRQALELLESARGRDHVDLLPALDNLVALYRTTRREAKAEEFRRRAAAIRKAHGLGASDTYEPAP
ncbi:MAG: tetratricopeptide repeat-containing protein [Pseudomonadota bacterium]